MLSIDQIRTVVADFFEDKPVKQVWLFGSYARGEATEESDVDLLINLDRSKKVGLQFYSWFDSLRDLLRVKVDVVINSEKPEHTSNWHVLQHMNLNKRLLYEKG